MTEFRKLAERIAEDINGDWACCFELRHTYKNEAMRNYLFAHFSPTLDERKLYGMDYDYWLDSCLLTNTLNNSFRILILLFAEQHYLHYKKIDLHEQTDK